MRIVIQSKWFCGTVGRHVFEDDDIEFVNNDGGDFDPVPVEPEAEALAFGFVGGANASWR